MKFRLNNKYVRWGLTAFCVVAASICFYYLLFHIKNIKAGIGILTNVMMPIVIGLVLAYLLTPVLNNIEYRLIRPAFESLHIKETEKRNRLIRGIGILITSFLFFSVIYLLLSMLISQIVPSVTRLITNFDTYIDNITKVINKLLEDNPEAGSYAIWLLNKYSVELENWVNNKVIANTTDLIKTVSMSVINVLGVLLDFIVGFIISVYVLASKEKLAGQAKKIAYAFLDKESANIWINNFRFTHKTFIGFITGKVLDSIIIGLLCFIGTTLLGTPYAALVSVIIGCTNVIPFFGPALGAIPCALLIFLVDPMHPLACLYFVIFILVLQQFDGNILGPKILGESTGLSGFWVIFAITFFGGLFGIPGMIAGVPVFAVIFAAVKSVISTALAKKNMPLDTQAYLNVESVDEEGTFHPFVPQYQIKIEQERQAQKQRREARKQKEQG